MSILGPLTSAYPKLHGGLSFTNSITPPITRYPTPGLLNISLIQHQGSAAKVIVKTGEHVFKGQPLTTSDHLAEVPVHASSSGTVTAINQTHISIQTDQNEPLNKNPNHHQTLTRDQLSQLIHQHGLVGLGGAGYPTAQKIAHLEDQTSTILVNAAECDPLIHCDNALMREYADHIIAGIKAIAESCSIDRVIIGIEDNKPEAIKRINDANDQAGFNAEIITVPSVYPSGAEKLLLNLCGISNSDTPSHYPLAKQGILSLNVATCYAVYNAVTLGAPLISRTTTIVDIEGIIQNFDIPVGTPIADIYKTVHETNGLPDEKLIDAVIGGKMMGRLTSLSDSTIKTTNCIAFSASEKKTRKSTACIRCGACADICPAHLLPQQLYTFSLNFNATALDQYQLNQCIECACCDTVCPSHLPLTQHFISAKQKKTELKLALQQAEIAKYRFEKREQRLATTDESRARRSAAPQETKSSSNNKPDVNAAADSKKALIEAALQRKKNRDSSKPPGGNQSGQT